MRKISPVARPASESKSIAPQSTRPGATIAWKAMAYIVNSTCNARGEGCVIRNLTNVVGFPFSLVYCLLGYLPMTWPVTQDECALSPWRRSRAHRYRRNYCRGDRKRSPHRIPWSSQQLCELPRRRLNRRRAASILCRATPSSCVPARSGLPLGTNSLQPPPEQP